MYMYTDTKQQQITHTNFKKCICKSTTEDTTSTSGNSCSLSRTVGTKSAVFFSSSSLLSAQNNTTNTTWNNLHNVDVWMVYSTSYTYISRRVREKKRERFCWELEFEFVQFYVTCRCRLQHWAAVFLYLSPLSPSYSPSCKTYGKLFIIISHARSLSLSLAHF